MRKNRPVLHGVELKEPKPFPLIEIVGPIDCGKKTLATLVARRLSGTTFIFPVLDMSTPLGKALTSAIISHPIAAEGLPGWWCHLYAAALYEQSHFLTGLKGIKPLVTVNYVVAARLWAKAAGLKNLKGWTYGLPEPDITYTLVGPKWQNPGNIPVNFSEEFKARVDRSLAHPTDKRALRIVVDPLRNTHDFFNTAADLVCEDLVRRGLVGKTTEARYTSKQLTGFVERNQIIRRSR